MGKLYRACGGGIQWRVRSIFPDHINGSHFEKENAPPEREGNAICSTVVELRC